LGLTEEKYLEYIGKLLDIAGKRKSDIACLPEDFAELGKNAQPVTGPVGSAITPYASKHDMYIIMPIIEIYEGKNYGTAVLFDRKGNVAGRYQKVHPIVGEMKNYKVSKGNEIPVFQTDFGSIGIMICFDINFPEMSGIMTRKGAKIIFMPHQLCTPDPITYMLQVRAHAVFNSVHVVASTWGTRHGTQWDPRNRYPSCVVGCDGSIIAASEKEEGVLTAHLDPDHKWMVEGHAEPGVHDMQWILNKYRRPDLYKEEDPMTWKL